MGYFSREGQMLIWQENQQRVWLQAWGNNGLRCQANVVGERLKLPQALLENDAAETTDITIEIGTEEASIKSGLIKGTISRTGRIRYTNVNTDAILLEEPDLPYFAPPNRHFKYRDGRLYRIEAWFMSQENERFYGLGQHQHGRLDQKGCVIELHQRNTEVAIPFLISSRRYGFLWNNPAVGRVELGYNATRWVAEGSQQLDYYVVCGENYNDILESYADATGHSPLLPEWASGFWQCKLRYETQDELLNVAREYKRRGLPLSVIVSDFFNWSRMGDWRFDPANWPDPPAMVQELEGMGVKLMVSVWPTVSPFSENYEKMRERGLLINSERGVDALQVFLDNGVDGPAHLAYYDATNPEARQFIWETLKENYYAQGVRAWWLDSDEPDANPWNPENLRFYLGNGLEVANIYPLLHQRAFYEGMREAGESEIVTLSRSAWAGSQRYSSVLWSGDIASTFEALRAQVRAGLNVAMSGVPWWTTDIGGFYGGDITGITFRELIIRWFQYGVFCPIFRLHGHRMPILNQLPRSGADNELWSFGDEAYEILRQFSLLRERLRPYIHKQMKIASESGLPPMRPIFVDFTNDPLCETIDDQFLFGSDLLVAPVLHAGARTREVYLPAGAVWMDANTGKVQPGGQWVTAVAPLDTIPLYLKSGSKLQDIFPFRTTA
jgi:alpha-D-xyloside xylohydrolase